MELSIGLSPCPNDIFMFEALLSRRIHSGDIRFRPVIEDVEQLNQKALQGELDISKLSYHVIGKTLETYQILDSGSALGYHNGPILVSAKKTDPSSIHKLRIAIPGHHTTANLLLGIFHPAATKKTAYLFSDIEDVVLRGEQDAGLLIHESRFTYEKKGLTAIEDLGSLWEKTQHMPIPLGGIAIKRDIPKEVSRKVNELIRKSIVFAIENPDIVASSIRAYAQEKDDSIIKQHIGMFVNDFSLSLGEKGRGSIKQLFDLAYEKGMIPAFQKNTLFITP